MQKTRRYDLSIKPGSPLSTNVSQPKSSMDRSVSWRSRLPLDKSYASRLDTIYETDVVDMSKVKFDMCSAKMIYEGVATDGHLCKRETVWKSFIDGVVPDMYSQQALSIVTILGQFHTATTSQISSLIGMDFDDTSRLLHLLYGSGILKRSSIHTSADSMTSRYGDLWRLGYGRTTGPLLEGWLDELSDFEYFLVTQGRDITRGVGGSSGLYTHRHNIQSLDMAIRFMERSPYVAGVFGEQACAIEKFVDTSRNVVRGNIADFAVVGIDGKVILFELTTVKNAGNGITAKALGWSIALALNNTGIDLYVVFANTNPEHDRQVYRTKVLDGIFASEGYFGNPGKSLQIAQQRIFVSDVATHWFPSSHAITNAFDTMDVYNPCTMRFYSLLPESTKWKAANPTINALSSIHNPNWITNEVLELV